MTDDQLSKLDVPWQDFMEEPIDAKVGYKHHPTDRLIANMHGRLNAICEREHLRMNDISLRTDRRITEREYWKHWRGQQQMDERNARIREDGYEPAHT